MEAGLPLLLIKAAQSAAQADGLPPPPTGQSLDNGSKANGKNGRTAFDHHPNSGLTGTQGLSRAKQDGPTAPAPSKLRSQLPATSVSSGNPSGGKKKGPPLRRGKWTPEEEAYANRLIQEFKSGLLPLTDGTTLRTFLSKLLNCDPMRISKKFVGSNCIGKQVFRRRTADINRLSPDQIQQSRSELSELERRFLERVAQTNRVKSSGVGGNAGGTSSSGVTVGNKAREEVVENTPPSPPWLQPPSGYKQGTGATMAQNNLSENSGKGDYNSFNCSAAAGRALLLGLNAGGLKSEIENNKPNNPLASGGSAGLLAMAELHRRASKQSLLQNTLGNTSSANNLLAAAAVARSGSNSGFSSMAQLAQSASAARIAELAAGNSMNNLLLKTGLSRNQLSQLARDRCLSSASLSNILERQNSFDALMSLDFQSLKSIDNLANLIQSGGSSGGRNADANELGTKNWSGDSSSSRSNLAEATATIEESTSNISNTAQRLASTGRMESLLRSLSGNLNNASVNSSSTCGGGSGSSANLNNILQSMQHNLGSSGNNENSTNNLLSSTSPNPSTSAVSLANLLRPDSSTGLTALRMQEGLNQRNSSVEDFLSLVAAGDIPHQDPSMLNIPLMQQQAAAAAASSGSSDPTPSAAVILAQKQLLAQASSSGLSLRSFGNLASSLSNNNNHSSSAARLALAQARALEHHSSTVNSKRKLVDLEGSLEIQETSK